MTVRCNVTAADADPLFGALCHAYCSQMTKLTKLLVFILILNTHVQHIIVMFSISCVMQSICFPCFSLCAFCLADISSFAILQAAFLGQLVGSDMAVASAHNYIKSLSGNAPGTEIASRCCFLLEDPPDDKETTASERYVIDMKSLPFL